MATPIALLKFRDALNTGASGASFVSGPGYHVTIENDNPTDIGSWKVSLLYAPPGVAPARTRRPWIDAPIVIDQNPNSSVVSAVLSSLESMPGCYRIMLEVWSNTNYSGVRDVDIRNIAVPEPYLKGILTPYQDDPLPLTHEGPGAKPDEMNFPPVAGGDPQSFGWSGDNDPGRRMTYEFFKEMAKRIVTIENMDWQPSVLSQAYNAPPGPPSDGDRYIVKATGSGDWTGHDNQITTWSDLDSAWLFTALSNGMATYVEDENKQYAWSGSAWVLVGSGSSLTPPGGGEDYCVAYGLSGDLAYSPSVKTDASGNFYVGVNGNFQAIVGPDGPDHTTLLSRQGLYLGGVASYTAQIIVRPATTNVAPINFELTSQRGYNGMGSNWDGSNIAISCGEAVGTGTAHGSISLNRVNSSATVQYAKFSQPVGGTPYWTFGPDADAADTGDFRVPHLFSMKSRVGPSMNVTLLEADSSYNLHMGTLPYTNQLQVRANGGILCYSSGGGGTEYAQLYTSFVGSNHATEYALAVGVTTLSGSDCHGSALRLVAADGDGIDKNGGDIYVISGGGTGVGVDGDIIFQRGAVEIARWTTGSQKLQLTNTTIIEFGSSVNAPIITQADVSSGAQDLTIRAQRPSAGPGDNRGGCIVLAGGIKTGSGAVGDIIFKVGNYTLHEIARFSQGTAPFAEQGKLLFAFDVIDPIITQTNTALTGDGYGFTVKAQDGVGSNKNGGPLTLQSGAATGVGVTGDILFNYGLQTRGKFTKSVASGNEDFELTCEFRFASSLTTTLITQEPNTVNRAGAPLTIQAQAATGSVGDPRNGGDLRLKSGAQSYGTAGSIVFYGGNTIRMTMLGSQEALCFGAGPYPTVGTLRFGMTAPTVYALEGGVDRKMLGWDGSMFTLGNTSWLQTIAFSSSLYFGASGSFAEFTTSGGAQVKFGAALGDITIKQASQAAPGTAGHITIQSQYAGVYGQGGDLSLITGDGTSPGDLYLQLGGGGTIRNAANFTMPSAPDMVMEVGPSTGALLISRPTSTSGSGKETTIKGQEGAPGGWAGGAITIQTGAPSSVGPSPGDFNLKCDTARILKWVGASQCFEMGLGTVASTGSLRLPNNFTIYAADGLGGNAGVIAETGTIVIIGGGSTQAVQFQTTTTGGYFNYSINSVETFIVDQFGFHFGDTLTSVLLNQWNHLTGAGVSFTIQAQNGRGGSAVAGGDLILTSGTHGSIAALDGSLQLQLGGDLVARFYEGSSYLDKHFELNTGNVDFIAGVAPTFTQPDTIGAANTFTIRAQNSTTAAGAQLLFYGGNSVSAAAGDIQFWAGVAATLGVGGSIIGYAGAGAGSSSGGGVTFAAGSGSSAVGGGEVSLSTGSGIGSGAGSGTMRLATGDAGTTGYARSILFTTGYAPSGAAFRGSFTFRYGSNGSGGVANLLNIKGDVPGTLEFGKTVTPIINQEVDTDNAGGKTFTIQAQAGNGAGNNNGGNLDFKSGAKVNSGVVGAVRLYADSTLRFAVDGTGLAFFNGTTVAQPSHTKVVDSTGGIPNGTMSAVAGTGDDTTINKNLAELAAKINDIANKLGGTSGVNLFSVS